MKSLLFYQDSGCRRQIVDSGNDHGIEYEAYRSGGRNRFTMDELLRPYQVSAIHSGMSWQTPIVVYGMGTADAGKNIAEGANLYKQRVEMLIGSSNAGNNW